MANTRNEIVEMISAAGYNFNAEGDHEIYLWIDGMKTYRDRSGNDIALVILNLFASVNNIQIFSPSCFAVPDEPEREGLFFKACTILNWKSTLCKYKYEPVFGLFEAVVDYPIDDYTMTQKQLITCINELIYMLNLSYPLFDKISKEGVIDLDLIDEKKWLKSFLGIAKPPSAELLDEIYEKSNNDLEIKKNEVLRKKDDTEPDNEFINPFKI